MDGAYIAHGMGEKCLKSMVMKPEGEIKWKTRLRCEDDIEVDLRK
jgi:hypothetical protein